jgi:tRNA pseudouridine55 synthase
MALLGLLNICKVPGMSSHSVVSRVRRILDMQRVGHSGTLDPVACGVLVVCVGRATRLADYISAESKSYRAEVLLGVTTASADAEGTVTRVADASALTRERVLAALPAFTGALLQRPPLFSAVQIGGQRAYELARRGVDTELPLREVTIHALTLAHWTPGAYPRVLLDISCSKGTYIRSLARDLGEALGVGGCLSFLARTRVATCTLEESVTLEEVAAAATEGRLEQLLLPPDAPLAHLPILTMPSGRDWHQELPPTSRAPGLYRIYQDERLVGLARQDGEVLRPLLALPREQEKPAGN